MRFSSGGCGGHRPRLKTNPEGWQVAGRTVWRMPNPATNAIKLAFLCLAALSLSSCAGGHVADMPHWMGGLPPDVPPRPGTPEYDAWMAKRAQGGKAEDWAAAA